MVFKGFSRGSSPVRGVPLSLLAAFLFGCAGSSSELPGGDAPCEDCGERGEIELDILDEVFYREWNASAYSRFDSTAAVGVFPALKLEALAPEKCKFCHGFSEDALDFDLSRVEDSLWARAFPKMRRELMFPGMQVPEADSTFLDSIQRAMLATEFADSEPLGSLDPWKERSGTEQVLARAVPFKLKASLEVLASRYRVRYVSLPISLRVEMLPKAGKKGGYTWESLWALFDARYGELVFLNYSSFRAETRTRIAPERLWAEPFAARLEKMFTTKLSEVEPH